MIKTKPTTVLTKQSLKASLMSIMEYGFKSCERGWNLDQTIAAMDSLVNSLVNAYDNVPDEIARIKIQ